VQIVLRQRAGHYNPSQSLDVQKTRKRIGFEVIDISGLANWFFSFQNTCDFALRNLLVVGPID